jgi:hypothetical protein
MSDDLVSDTDDEKRIRQAETRAWNFILKKYRLFSFKNVKIW